MGDTRDWIFTFGFGHEAPDGTPLRKRFVRIRGTHESARDEMVRRWGLKWAFQYESEEAAGVERFGLMEIA